MGWTDAAFRRAFGRVLRRLRSERGLSQEGLAESAGYHVNHVSYLERGRRSPTLYAVFQLARALEVSPVELVRQVQVEWVEWGVVATEHAAD